MESRFNLLDSTTTAKFAKWLALAEEGTRLDDAQVPTSPACAPR